MSVPEGLCNLVKLSVLVALCVQNAAYTLIRKYSVQIEQVDAQTILCVAEAIKLVFSAVQTVYFAEEASEGNAAVSVGERGLSKMARLAGDSSKMAVLAGIYAAMNILSFVALRRIDAVTFTVCAQLKILTTALCALVFLGRPVSPTKWRALILLVLASILVSVPQIDNAREKDSDLFTQAIGILAVLLEVTLSGAASVYFEKVVKTKADGMSLWDRNFQLAMWSILLYTLYGFAESAFFAGASSKIAIAHGVAAPCSSITCFSPVTWLVAILSAGGGLLVALSIKVADSVLKTISLANAIVLTTLFSHWFLAGPLNLTIGVGSLCSVLGVLNYAFDASPPVQGASAVVEAEIRPLLPSTSSR